MAFIQGSLFPTGNINPFKNNYCVPANIAIRSDCSGEITVCLHRNRKHRSFS